MNIWSLIYFTGFLFYVYSGSYVLSLNRKAFVNVMFFFMCITLSAWSLGYSLSTGAVNVVQALSWRGISTFGWTFFYSTMLIFIIVITHSQYTFNKIKYLFLLYIPSLAFFLRFWHHDTGNYTYTEMGWVYLLYFKGLWSYAFDLYYIVCVLASIILLVLWRKKVESIRERRQVHIILSTLSLAFLFGGLTDTVLPLLGFKILPLGIIFCSIAISGMWVAITKYKMMNLTQEIAAEHVLITMMDPVIVLNHKYIIGQVNKATLDLTGYTARELIGKPIACIIDLYHDHAVVKQELDEKHFTNGHEVNLKSKFNKLTLCLCSGVNVKTDYGEKIGAVLVLHDITLRKQSEQLLEQVNTQLKLEITKLNNVFDNVREGILTFHRDLIIQSEYSQECERIFGRALKNDFFPSLIYPENIEMGRFTTSLLQRIFEIDEDSRALYLPLLPDTIQINHKTLSLDFKFTKDASSRPMIMAILSDTTEKIQLESQMDLERRTLKMVIKTILNREDFIELLEDFQSFIQQSALHVFSDYENTLRAIHTYKGNFSLFDMLHLVDLLDDIETELIEAKMCLNEHLLITLSTCLNRDLQIIEDIVGKDYFVDGGRLTLDVKLLHQIEDRIQAILSKNEAALVLPLIQNLRYKSYHELLKNYPDFTYKLAARWDKVISPFTITGDRVYVDVDKHQEVVKALVHVFRNCVAHGIEGEDERIENNKEPMGHIACEIKDFSSSIQIKISDDGRGIDLGTLKARVIENNLMTQLEYNSLTLEEQQQLIFVHSLTTQSGANQLSGRGLGLAALKQAVVHAGGNVRVISQVNIGTAFLITVPK